MLICIHGKKILPGEIDGLVMAPVEADGGGVLGVIAVPHEQFSVMSDLIDPVGPDFRSVVGIGQLIRIEVNPDIAEISHAIRYFIIPSVGHTPLVTDGVEDSEIIMKEIARTEFAVPIAAVF